MTPKHLKKIDYHIAIWGSIAIALTAVTGGFALSLSALAGALIGMGNWLVFRRLVLGIAASGDGMGLGLFLALKFLVLLGVVSLVIVVTPIEPIPFTAGISALFLGISTYYFSLLFNKGASALGGDD